MASKVDVRIYIFAAASNASQPINLSQQIQQSTICLSTAAKAKIEKRPIFFKAFRLGIPAQ
jgi:hypothetical protein